MTHRRPRTRHWIVLSLVVIAICAGSVWLLRDRLAGWLLHPTESHVTPGKSDTRGVMVVAENLTTPWSLAWAGDELMVTERGGQLRRVGTNGQTYQVAGVRETSEGGLLGLAVDPAFERNRALYLYLSTERDGRLVNQIDRYTYRDGRLTFERTIFHDIPAASNHNGGALAFGPDGALYVTTGDANQPDTAQQLDSLSGKILRMTRDGSLPADNPYPKSYVWSYGHRNPQGLAWDAQGRLWSVEHGPSGAESGFDELNLIEKGANYGWPVIRGDQTHAGMKSPVAQSGADETWAPAGLAYSGGALYFSGLRGQSLYRAQIDGDNVRLTRHFTGTYGRLRAVAVRGDQLYLTTSNRDGHGIARDGGDKILRLPLTTFSTRQESQAR